MVKNNKLDLILILSIATLSSCSQEKYTHKKDTNTHLLSSAAYLSRSPTQAISLSLNESLDSLEFEESYPQTSPDPTEIEEEITIDEVSDNNTSSDSEVVTLDAPAVESVTSSNSSTSIEDAQSSSESVSITSTSSEASTSSTPAVNYLNQRWVGYWGAAMNGAGNGNYIAETASVSNAIFIRDDNELGWKKKLKECKDHNLKAILMVTNVFYPWASSVLDPNYEHNFQVFWDSLKDYQDIVVGFYVFDEPFWNNVSKGWITVPNPTLKASLTKVIDLLHDKLPGRFTAISYSTVELDNPNFASAFLPDNLDMWGVNCYLPACSDSALVGYWNKMISNLKPNQKLLVTLDSYWHMNPGVWVGYWPESALTYRLRQWKSLIAAHQDKVMGFFPFLYQYVPSENLFGAENMPNVKAEYSVYMEALQGKVYCSVNTLIRVNSEGQELGRWENAPMCVPQCEGKNYVRRDALGKVLDVWYNAPAPYCN